MDSSSPVSQELMLFTEAAKLTRVPILAFMQRIALLVPDGSAVLDVGAGEAPYRELFSHTGYLTCDWEGSDYEQAQHADIVASADSLPVEDASYDAVINTQVLEHVRHPDRVLAELHRVLRTDGRLFLTAPLVWYLHEVPHDFYRYTSFGLSHLLEQAGFTDVDIRPMNDSFTTVAQMLAHLGFMAGRTEDGYNLQRDMIERTMGNLSALVASYSDLDTQWIMPLNYAVTARRGERPAQEAGSLGRALAAEARLATVEEQLESHTRALAAAEAELSQLRGASSAGRQRTASLPFRGRGRG